MYYKKLVGEKVYLSPVDPDDVETYTKWVNDLDVAVKIGNATHIYSESKESRFLDNMAEGDRDFSIILKDGDVLLGSCSLFSVNYPNRTAQLGIFIGDAQQRGKGYGSEAIRLLLCCGFKILNLRNIMLKAFSFNTYAIKAYERIGFEVFGIRSGSYYCNGKYYDEYYMQILSDNFKCDYLNDLLPSDEGTSPVK